MSNIRSNIHLMIVNIWFFCKIFSLEPKQYKKMPTFQIWKLIEKKIYLMENLTECLTEYLTIYICRCRKTRLLSHILSQWVSQFDRNIPPGAIFHLTSIAGISTRLFGGVNWKKSLCLNSSSSVKIKLNIICSWHRFTNSQYQKF